MADFVVNNYVIILSFNILSFSIYLQIGYEHKNSPTEAFWLLLPAFKLEHVREIYRKYFLKNLRISYLKAELEEDFCEKLTSYTGGVPRLLEYTYNLLKIINDEKQGLLLDSEETIDSLLVAICEFISKKALDIQQMRYREHNPEIRLAALILYSSSVFGITFNVNDTLPGTKHPLRELMDRIPFWITGTSDKCQIVHPKVKELYLQDQFDNIPPFRILTGIREQSQKDTLDIAELYEFLCASLIVHHCKLQKGRTFSEFPGKLFNDTVIFNEIIQEIPSSNINVFGKVVQAKESGSVLTVTEFQDKLKKISAYPSLIGVAKKSHSCDLYHIPSKNIVIGWQFKSGEQELYFGSKLQEEIDKFGHDPASSDKHNILILFSMEVDVRIQNLIGANKSCLILSEGVYQYKAHHKHPENSTFYNATDGYLVKFDNPSKGVFMPQEILIKGGIKKAIKTAMNIRNVTFFRYDDRNYSIENESNDQKLSYLFHSNSKTESKGGENGQWTGVTIPKNFTLIMMGEDALRGFIGENNLKDLRELVDQQGNRKENYPITIEKLSNYLYTSAMDVEATEGETLNPFKWIAGQRNTTNTIYIQDKDNPDAEAIGVIVDNFSLENLKTIIKNKSKTTGNLIFRVQLLDGTFALVGSDKHLEELANKERVIFYSKN